MNIFVDANVIINVFNKEYPAFDFSARLLSLTEDKRYHFYTSSLSLAICWYFAEKKSGAKIARKKIETLLEHFRISDCGENEVLKAISNKKAEDFEDALQVYSAHKSKCTFIITNNLEDFHFSEIPVLIPQDFLLQHARA
jgi:predicted nucleic acid-binding protein